MVEETKGEPQDKGNINRLSNYVAEHELFQSQLIDDFNQNPPKDAIVVARERADKVQNVRDELMADAKRIEEAVLIFTQKVEKNVHTEENE